VPGNVSAIGVDVRMSVRVMSLTQIDIHRGRETMVSAV